MISHQLKACSIARLMDFSQYRYQIDFCSRVIFKIKNIWNGKHIQYSNDIKHMKTLGLFGFISPVTLTDLSMKVHIVIFLYISLALLSNSKTAAQEDKHSHSSANFDGLELNQNLLIGSRWAIKQAQKNEKIRVYHAIELVDISRVDVNSMSIRVEIHIRQRWDALDMHIPEGLFEAGDTPDTFIKAPQPILKSMWSPESFIPNARETKVSAMTTTQSIVNIFQNKSIVFKVRLHTILGCSFTFQWYPLDRQTCDLTIESFKWTSDMVQYLWENQQSPLIIQSLKLLQYEMKQPLEYGNGTAPRWELSETYPYVMLRFTFDRQIANHMIQVYTPTILIVILSWFSFWLGMDAIPGRVSLLVICLLSLVTMQSAIQGIIPPVNYIKGMDVWMVGCTAFVFAALFEFIVVKYFHWKQELKLKNTDDREKAMMKYMSEKDKIQGKDGHEPQNQREFNPYQEFGRNVDEGFDGSYPIGMIQQVQKRSNKSNLNPAIISPSGGHLNPSEYQMIQRQNGHPPEWPFVQKKRPVWLVIDRVSRVAFPVVFGIFNSAYWPILFIGAANQ